MLTGQEHFTLPGTGRPPGFTSITRRSGEGRDVVPGLELDFGLRRMQAGEALTETHECESGWVLLHGTADLEFSGQRKRVARTSLFDEPPTALHLGPETSITVRSLDRDTEWA